MSLLGEWPGEWLLLQYLFCAALYLQLCIYTRESSLCLMDSNFVHFRLHVRAISSVKAPAVTLKSSHRLALATLNALKCFIIHIHSLIHHCSKLVQCSLLGLRVAYTLGHSKSITCFSSPPPPRFPPSSTFQPYQFVLTIWRMRRLPLDHVACLTLTTIMNVRRSRRLLSRRCCCCIYMVSLQLSQS